MASPSPGDRASLAKAITGADLDAFSALSLDANPVHLDDAYAARTRFGARIAHGPYLVSLVGAVMANELPGPGAVLLEQHLRFRRPAFVGDTVTASVEVTGQLRADRFRLAANVVNQAGETLVEGTVDVLFDPPA